MGRNLLDQLCILIHKTQTRIADAEEHDWLIAFFTPGHPEDNGVVERLSGTPREECLYLFWFKDPEDPQRRLSECGQKFYVARYH